jgi:hypothetical protein
MPASWRSRARRAKHGGRSRGSGPSAQRGAVCRPVRQGAEIRLAGLRAVVAAPVQAAHRSHALCNPLALPAGNTARAGPGKRDDRRQGSACQAHDRPAQEPRHATSRPPPTPRRTRCLRAPVRRVRHGLQTYVLHALCSGRRRPCPSGARAARDGLHRRLSDRGRFPDARFAATCRRLPSVCRCLPAMRRGVPVDGWHGGLRDDLPALRRFVQSHGAGGMRRARAGRSHGCAAPVG